MISNSENSDAPTRWIGSPAGTLRMGFVPEKGGIGTSLRYQTKNGVREMLWLHPDFYKMADDERYGGFPMLFPICGRQALDGVPERYRYEGKTYHLPIHGFAPRVPWTAEQPNPQTLVMRLADSPETRENYPFSFEVVQEYTAFDQHLVCQQGYTNCGDKPMPYMAGFHPYFAVPMDPELRAQCRVDFSAKEQLIYNEWRTDILGMDAPLSFPASITEPGINESLHRLHEGARNHARLTLEHGLSIELAAYGPVDNDLFPYIQLFTQQEYGFFCIEPWMGAPNGFNKEKGYRWLAPGASEVAILTLHIHEKNT